MGTASWADELAATAAARVANSAVEVNLVAAATGAKGSLGFSGAKWVVGPCGVWVLLMGLGGVV